MGPGDGLCAVGTAMLLMAATKGETSAEMEPMTTGEKFVIPATREGHTFAVGSRRYT